MGLTNLPAKNQHDHGPTRDGEMLAFLVEKLRPSVTAVFRQEIGKRFAALEVCLAQLEQMIAGLPEFESRPTIVRDMTVARTLCDRIQRDLGRG